MPHITLNVIRARGKAMFFRDADSRMEPWTCGIGIRRPMKRLRRTTDAAFAQGAGSSTTAGATAPNGMKTNLVTAYPTQGKYSFWPVTTPQGTEIWSRDMQSNDQPKRVGGPFQAGQDGYHSYDQTATHFRLWRTDRQPVEMGEIKSSRSAGASDTMANIRDRLARRMKARRSGDEARGDFPPNWTEREIRNALEQQVQLQQSEMYFGDPKVNQATWARQLQGRDTTKALPIPNTRTRRASDDVGTGLGVSARTWAAGGANIDRGEGGGGGTNPIGHKVENSSEIEGGVGAESFVNGRKTGYVIRTGDAARPGLAIGRANAKLVAARVGVLESINAANRKAWS